MTRTRSDVETLLADIWQDVLKVPKICPDDNLLDQGGNSLAAMRIVSRIQEAFGVNLPMSVVLGDTTLRDAADSLFSLLEQTSSMENRGSFGPDDLLLL
jgi:acyl carrier protein